METTDVLIVGAGPSGLVLGALLGRMGINVSCTSAQYCRRC
jgi:2-polyprenyl-6-methoxyphenol hydroxylase-like FAD-dependent oxidoreductase